MTAAPQPDQSAAVSIGYRLVRKVLRIWFSVALGKIRLLHAEALPASGAAMLLISHPASFLDALILVAAFERQVHCILDRRLLRGPLTALLVWTLGMIPEGSEGEQRRATLDAACQALAGRKAVMVFAKYQAGRPGGLARLVPTAAATALEAESRCSGQLGLAIYPIYLYLPIAPSQSSELLIHIDGALYAQDYLSSASGQPTGQAQTLSTKLEEACRQNAFRLQPAAIEQFLSDLEEVLRSNLEEEWAPRPNWKLQVGGFRLSSFVAEFVDQLNYLNPGRLVALREFLNDCLEARRRWSQRRLEVETAATWIKSPWRRIGVWIESAVGVPIAIYGLANHFLILLLLFASGLLKKATGPSSRVEWVGRGLIALGIYVGQIWLCEHWLGRAAAGYYAASLPISGAYLWRYGRLLRSRTRLLLIERGLPRRAAKLRRVRKEFLLELDGARNTYAEALGVPH